MNSALLALTATLFAVPVSGREPSFKQVAAPAEDIRSGRLRLPEPAATATSSACAMLPVDFVTVGNGTWVFETRLLVARGGPMALALLGFDAPEWNLSLRSADGEFQPFEVALGSQGVERRTQALDEFLGQVVERYDVERATAGEWVVRLTVTGRELPPAGGWLFLRDTAGIEVFAHTSTLSTLVEREFEIVAYLHESGSGDPARATPGLARAGQVVLETEQGRWRLDLLDDGQHGDGAPDDGLFGARVPRGTSGSVRARVELGGVTPEGLRFVRSVPLAFTVLQGRAVFDGSVATSVMTDGRVRIALGALPLAPAATLHVSTELWGTTAAGELVPVCWLSRMLEPEPGPDGWLLPLFLDPRWIALSGTQAPFVLRQVRVQDPDTSVPFDVVDGLPLAIPPPAPTAVTVQGTPTPSMLMAPVASGHLPPAAFLSRRNLVPRTLLLVHGYCSGGSIWPAAHFTQPKVEFLDPNQNRSHDQFARLLANRVDARSSFGVVAHSQGGPAALHLYTYYVSGLDRALGNRRIQSVASPYQGTPLASLGFFACGVNNNMTPAGSTTWLAGIPTWARSQVSYWTTADNGSACNFLTGLLLANPEDGTVERTRGQLPGANSMGHLAGWCHTTGMSYPANYTDGGRNANMNANASR